MWALDLTPVIEAEGKDWHFMGVFSKNREEWAVVDLACMCSSVTIVPFFDSLGPQALEYIIKQTGLTTMVTEITGLDHLFKIKPNVDSLKNLVVLDAIPEDKKARAE
jgi:long-chain acyl-CoA synthetase